MNTDWLLVLIVPLTAAAAWIARHGRRSAFIARMYMLVVFTSAGLASLGLIALDTETRVLLLRCGFLALMFDEVVTWVKLNRWSRKVANGNGKQVP